jgi:hypothetical protein
MKALKIYIPDFCAPEVSYSFEILFNCFQFTNLKFIKDDGLEDFIIATDDDVKILTIANHFFKKSMNYHEDLIPKNVKLKTINLENKSHQVISLFGKAEINMNRLELDIISSTFFMATRWEEQVVKNRDIHGRFDENIALSVIENFIQRPVINEYALLLKNLLQAKGVDTGSLKNEVDIRITFDIDYIFKWKHWKALIGNLLRPGPSIAEKINYIGSFVFAKIGGKYQKDSFFSFDYILKVLESYKQRSVFYFMVTKTNKQWDLNDYQPEDKPIKEAISKVKQKGHIIGLHSSYHAVEDAEQLKLEKKKLEEVTGETAEFIRPHFLRIFPEISLQLISTIGFKNESSMLYSRQFGFRCGCTYPIPYFDIKSRQKTELMMIPTIAMSSVGIESGYQSQKTIMKSLIQAVKEYGGKVQIIWHNSDFDTNEKKRYFEEVIGFINS